jgi:bifunctional oligoribonuclease and PAP phosphatase NrnA
MSSSTTVTEVLSAIGQHQRFLLTSHARPDGDAIGSVLGASLMLRELGKDVDVIMSDSVPVIYRGLPHADSIRHAGEIEGRYDAAIILECDSVQRAGLRGLEAAGRTLINIDHHTSARPFAHVNWIDPSACAVAQMVFELARAANVPITPELATCLYTAVLTDTGSFCFQGTDANTFALAQELVRAGADPSHIAQSVYFANPESKMRLLGIALGSLQRVDDAVWMVVTQQQMQQCGAIEEDCEGLVNYGLGIAGVEVAAFFRELPDGRYRVSLRSKGGVNVALIAAQFGGGGHQCAGGCSLPGPLILALEKITGSIARQRAGKQG